MTLRRRTFLMSSMAAIAAPALVSSAGAQSGWPQRGRTLRMIVPWPAGAANDALGRLIAERLQQKFGVAAVTENRVGGAGLLGTKAVVQADPDGYTLLASAFNTAVMPLVLKAAADFNPETDLEVLGRTAVAPLVCVMSASLPQKTLPEVIAAAKAEPSKWNFAISSLGSAGHLATIDFLRRAGVNIQMVPYRGTQPALQDIMGGNVQLLIDPSFALLPAALDGSRVRALGIATKERSVLAPSVPTMAEAGMPGFEFQSWYGIWAPKNLPADIANAISGLIQETMADPEVVQRLRTTLIEPISESREATRAFIRSDIVRATELLRLVDFQPS
ncbi:tripartite tricarboxylate transporter substrate binding protein [Phreatobacter sp.]|uniref:Bug family tripartite tricarboxylate transporter substrate binding protein n=1 Tax=Phreatobacter sp. TaxID=1966341 RepID=UPI0022C507BF|nr:tripartite tricarboxylate transporter substrate binding protein [Phreatobacter sp.]MCZ8315759.1 tripartite tricarboxylate transporter substrate binding protein [Phreatobacter sp.]